jgi:hypothetical protein
MKALPPTGPLKDTGLTIRGLYPSLTEDQLKDAEANFRRYLEIAVTVKKDQSSAGGDFDMPLIPTTMKERSDSLKS